MKIIMSPKEYLALNKVINGIAGKTIENDGKILTTEFTSTGYYVVEINEKYTAEMYSEYANWIPAIVSQLKSLYSLIESAFTVITKKENKLMKEINASSKIKEIK